MNKTIFAFLFFLAACKKEKISQVPIMEVLSVSNSQQITSNTLNNNIKTYVINGNTETITLNNGIIITRTKDLTNSELWHIVKTFTTGKKIFYNELVKVSGNTTSVSLYYLTGEKCFSTDISQSGQLSNLFQDKSIQSSCVGNAISVCLNNKGCFLLCTAGGWGGCILGWIIGCSFS